MTAFEAVHARLRDIMLTAAEDHVVTVDEPGDLVLRTAAIDPGTKEPGWFGTVTIKKSYVAYHLMPLYRDPSLADELSDGLRRRRQGKTCFNFKTIDETLFAELSALTRRANGRWSPMGRQAPAGTTSITESPAASASASASQKPIARPSR